MLTNLRRIASLESWRVEQELLAAVAQAEFMRRTTQRKYTLKAYQGA